MTDWRDFFRAVCAHSHGGGAALPLEVALNSDDHTLETFRKRHHIAPLPFGHWNDRPTLAARVYMEERT